MAIRIRLVFQIGLVWLAIGLIPNIAVAGKSRQKVIDFEDDLVEGIQKKPYDSLNSISEKNRNVEREHLYRKRAGFKTENGELFKELRFVQ